jgi:hypothetical protein
MAVNKDPQEVPGFVMEALKTTRRERPHVIGNISPLVYNCMIWEGYLEAGFWCYDNRHEACSMLMNGAVCKGFRPVPGSGGTYKEVSAYHKARYGEGTMSTSEARR